MVTNSGHPRVAAAAARLSVAVIVGAAGCPGRTIALPNRRVLYNRHAHTEWTTGRRCHHAAAIRFSQMLAAADGCPVRDHLDDARWGPAVRLQAIDPAVLAEFAGRQLRGRSSAAWLTRA